MHWMLLANCIWNSPWLPVWFHRSRLCSATAAAVWQWRPPCLTSHSWKGKKRDCLWILPMHWKETRCQNVIRHLQLSRVRKPASWMQWQRRWNWSRRFGSWCLCFRQIMKTICLIWTVRTTWTGCAQILRSLRRIRRSHFRWSRIPASFLRQRQIMQRIWSPDLSDWTARRSAQWPTGPCYTMRKETKRKRFTQSCLQGAATRRQDLWNSVTHSIFPCWLWPMHPASRPPNAQKRRSPERRRRLRMHLPALPCPK